jgi:transposase
MKNSIGIISKDIDSKDKIELLVLKFKKMGYDLSEQNLFSLEEYKFFNEPCIGVDINAKHLVSGYDSKTYFDYIYDYKEFMLMKI